LFAPQVSVCCCKVQDDPFVAGVELTGFVELFGSLFEFLHVEVGLSDAVRITAAKVASGVESSGHFYRGEAFLRLVVPVQDSGQGDVSEATVGINRDAAFGVCERLIVAAEAGLVVVGGDDAARALVFALRNQDRGVRKLTVNALGQIGGDAAIDYLLLALTDRSRAIRRAAAANLNLLEEEAQ